ncbi:MAG: flavodoxin family protein [bacterium]|nr:flavodoxin family protein [bacterium]
MSKKKIIIALGSPREDGNSAALAQKAADGIKAEGSEFEILPLHEMNIKPCRGCDSCRNMKETDTNVENFCVVDDDMKSLYPKLLRADAIIMAGPVYWFTVSAQTKLFMDRWYALGRLSSYGLKGKHAGIILVYGDSDPFNSGAVNALRTFQDTFRYLGVSIEGMVYGSAVDAGDIKTNDELMIKAFQLGTKLATL